MAANGQHHSQNDSPPLLEVTDLRRHFRLRRKGGLFGKTALLKAVDGISFAVAAGEAFGIVGESGCGKSTAARLVLNMIAPTAGRVVFDGRDILTLTAAQLRSARRRMQYVFQNPQGALDPRMTIVAQTIEPLDIHKIGTPGERRDKAEAVLRSVGMKDHTFDRYSHELSGGQCQRAVLARALILEPRLLVCDEPVSALDVSIQAQVVNLLDEQRHQLDLTMIFISHDLNVVSHICDRVAVMYLGKIVELAETEALFEAPAHPYTQALLSAIPIPEPGLRREQILLKGDPPSPFDPPSGCAFRSRCQSAKAVCAQETPKLKTKPDGQMVACHLAHGEG